MSRISESRRPACSRLLSFKTTLVGLRRSLVRSLRGRSSTGPACPSLGQPAPPAVPASLILLFLLAQACSSTSPTEVHAGGSSQHVSGPLAAVFSDDGKAVVTLDAGPGGECFLSRVSVGKGSLEPFTRLPFCPTSIDRIPSGFYVAGATRSAWIAGDGSVEPLDGRLVAAASRENFVLSRNGKSWWIRRGARRVVKLRTGRLSSGGEVLIGISSHARGEQVVRWNGDGSSLVLTPLFNSIDSLDVAPDGKQVVFSASRNGNFDIGLVSVDGGEVHWAPADPARERAVSWAPRGHKIGYLIETSSGTLFRTVHIPTSASLTVDLGMVESTRPVWDLAAEHVAVVSESPGSSPLLQIFRYGGEERHPLTDPKGRSTIDFQPFAPSVFVAPPPNARYSEHYPAVVWIGEKRPFRWSAVRARLAGEGVGQILTNSEPSRLDAHFWESLRELPWLDRNRLFVVSFEAVGPDTDFWPAAAKVILPGPARGPHPDRIVFVGADDVESSSLRLLEPLVKESSATHGLP
jgi:hypothetical protein